MAVLKTYIGAVKPVGEKIVLNYVRSATTVVDDDFDFILDENYYVIGMTLTKTVAAVGVSPSGIGATLIRIPTSGVQLGATVVAQCQLANTAVGTGGALGQTCIAGVPVTSNAIAATNIIIPVSAAAPLAAGTTASSWCDPITPVQANSATAGTGNSRQWLRLKIKSNISGAAFNPSCVVTIELAKYVAGITQGATGNSNQLDEVLLPELA